MGRVIVIIAVVLIGYWALTPDEWLGVVYPDASNLTNHRQIGTFPSLEECRATALDETQIFRNQGRRPDYECGLNCRPKSGLLVCEKTER